MSILRGTRKPKPPTRRELAAKLAETIPAINIHSGNLDVLKAELDALSASVPYDVTTDERACQGCRRLRRDINADLDAQRDRLTKLETAQTGWQAQSFVNRLLWLVRGVQA